MSNEVKSGILEKKGQQYFPVTHVSLVQGLQDLLSGKQEALVSGENIKTINGESILGSGNIESASAYYLQGTINLTSTPPTATITSGSYAEAVEAYNAGSPIYIAMEESNGIVNIYPLAIITNGFIAFVGYGEDSFIVIVVPSTNSPEVIKAGIVHPEDISQFITNSVNNLVNYYTKTETYTKTEVAQLIANTLAGSFVSVNVLPPTPTADNLGKIYLVPSDVPDENNIKNEFIVEERNGSYYWEQIGSTALSLDGYATTEDLEEAIESLEDSLLWEPGEGENSVQQKGTNLTVFGNASNAEGMSSTKATERGITTESSNSEIIEEWESSDPSDEKFALVKGEAAHIEGNNNLALGKNSHAEGNGCVAADNSAHAEGTGSQALGKYSHAEGLETVASGNSSHSEGRYTLSSGESSHAEGRETVASGNRSHTEGMGTQAKGNQAHAEGNDTTANAWASHTEGYNTETGGNYSSNTKTPDTDDNNGDTSHAEGNATIAKGPSSHAEGIKTFTQNKGEHAEGFNNRSNKASSTFGNAGNTIHSVGIGGAGTSKNAFEIMQNGDAYLYGIGGYNGTNPSNAESLQTVINSKLDIFTLIVDYGSTDVDAINNALFCNYNSIICNKDYSDLAGGKIYFWGIDTYTNIDGDSPTNCSTGNFHKITYDTVNETWSHTVENGMIIDYGDWNDYKLKNAKFCKITIDESIGPIILPLAGNKSGRSIYDKRYAGIFYDSNNSTYGWYNIFVECNLGSWDYTISEIRFYTPATLAEIDSLFEEGGGSGSGSDHGSNLIL